MPGGDADSARDAGDAMSIGLCMIVKDEAHVIERCLRSVKPYVQHWTVVDTGSSDGTPELVTRLMAGVPGAVVHRPWVDFGHNRTEALRLARPHTDYSWVIDADEEFVAPETFRFPDTSADAVVMNHIDKLSFARIALLANRLEWSYVGVIHETPEVPGGAKSLDWVDGAFVRIRYDGGRSKGLSVAEKYARDVLVLEKAVQDEPDNSRYQYYLARSYAITGRSAQALEAYRRRIAMGGTSEEVFHSHLETARLLQVSGAGPDEVIAAHLAAWQARPTRAEPLVALATWCRTHSRFPLGRMIARQATEIARPTRDVLWVDESVYAWRARAEYALCTLGGGDLATAVPLLQELLEQTGVPAPTRAALAATLARVGGAVPAQAVGPRVG